MKPSEVLTGAESEISAEEMECEMQAREFFVHIGMLILEGRTPQCSEKGRVEGPHCLSFFNVVPHVCDQKGNYSCQKVSERKEKMNDLWENSFPLVISVLIEEPSQNSLILLERWTVEVVNESDVVHGRSGSMLMQAIRSHIHFSQLSAWLSRSKGSLPSKIIYRISETGEESSLTSFLKHPDLHVFPLANLHSNRALQVSVHSLPRCDIFNFTDEILASKIDQLSAGHKVHKNGLQGSDLSDDLFTSPLKKKSCMKELETNNHSQTLNGHNRTNKQNRLDVTNPSTSRTFDDQIERNSDQKVLISPKMSQESLKKRFLNIRSLSEGTPGMSLQAQTKQYDLNKIHEPTHNIETKKSCDTQISSSIHIPKGVIQALKTQRVGAGTLPIFNSRTGLPVSSSPAPLRRSATDLDIEDDCREQVNGFSNNSSSKDLTSILSKSAPASTTQSLLGNFEESVLNGRMEPLGTVEGFTAELGASGSFCPAHVKLPVKASFFSLSDDNAPSPYLGYISLSDPSISHKGYHIPNKGTVQLTLFNPNKTVVKMFVVLFDFSDMPPRSQTFLRQRTFSVWRHTCQSTEGCNSLHYLIHLRFVSSKSGRLYLHTDIRVIFARQPPDLPSGVKFCTVTDGPTEPRYTQYNHKLV